MQVILLALLSSFLWGVTNPFLGKASKGIEKIESDRLVVKILLELKFLFTNINVSFNFTLSSINNILAILST